MRLLLAVLAASLAGCTTVDDTAFETEPQLSGPPPRVEMAAQSVLSRPNISAIGMARIVDGRLAWTGYWGEQTDGIPVGPYTAFNVASVAKTILAETTLRLADRTELDLDDPISEYYIHPDLGRDGRYAKLTPRILLSHQAALLNWPYAYDDGKLAFVGEPGSGEIHYSGAGFTILMRYLEERFGRKYPALVEDYLFGPLQISGIAVSREPWLEGRVPQPVDKEGREYAPFTNDSSGALIAPGEYNPADNLYATVPSYAKYLIRLIEGSDLSPELRQERQQLLSRSDTVLGYVCVARQEDCPDPLGFGLGWTLFGEPDRMIINHSGNDFAEHAQVYFSPDSREGLVIFMVGGEAFEQGLELIEATDPNLLMARHYRALFDSMKRDGS
ncbi:serine hydrolase [Qipengyuania sp. XHP0207]|uniref:serine hydrolase domain-containing protein n=1 Tax=Qipengyuania sp. XHP0207 TaxID=3038078 RepID=UPI00241E42BB|nr:serine hydrolase domain-containing protein [Qipengyuania sp. XHP0207]MDG5747207.1 serine hydrolase [Qipengyuania sp. XHP0207]